EAAAAAADKAAGLILASQAAATESAALTRIVASTGVSQFQFLKRLIGAPGIVWQRVELFHLDEYIGLSADHSASFQRYIRERIAEPAGILHVHYLDGMAEPSEMCAAAAKAISATPIDVLFAGIGENGHLAFNDPPADFDTEDPFLIVSLDESGRRQ